MRNITFCAGTLIVTWNFHESGHGKGVADGVSATIKRVADGTVLRGCYIIDAKSMYEVVKPNTTIKIYGIPNAIMALDVLRVSPRYLAQCGSIRSCQTRRGRLPIAMSAVTVQAGKCVIATY